MWVSKDSSELWGGGRKKKKTLQKHFPKSHHRNLELVWLMECLSFE